MGEPIVDLSPVRVNRTIRRVITNQTVLGMYGDAGHIQEMARRIGRIAAERRGLDMPGKVVYDVEPIVFDDLIEIRTGGDKAMSLALQTHPNLPSWVSFWPLSLLTENDTKAGWEATLDDVRDVCHQVTVENNSPLEQFLTFDMGYQAARRDPNIRMWRQLTHPRWVEEIRELDRPLVTAGRSDNGLWLARPETGEYIYDDSLRTREEEAIDAAPEDEPEVEWIAERQVYTTDDSRVWVNIDGIDEAGYNPFAPGYRVGFCNCDDCRETRIDEEEDRDDYEEDEE